jgi:hypothetical protein
MSAQHVLTFTSEGQGHGLYTELIDLCAVGTLSISRATSVEFDGSTQQWEVRAADGTFLFRHPSREVCLAWEHRHFNQ